MKAVDGMYAICHISEQEKPILTLHRFLLAQLHIDPLKGKMSPKTIRKALQKLPTGSEAYDYAYKDAMDRIEGQLVDEVELAKKILAWITCATRPLSTTELEHALAVEPDELELDTENICPVENMISVCAGLVTVDEESTIIRLVHYTTQEYFELTQSNWFPNAEADITSTCITYLSFRTFESGHLPNDAQFEERLDTNKLYLYASCHWGHHAYKAAAECHDEVANFLRCKAKVEASSQVLHSGITRPSSFFDYSQDIPRQVTGTHLAVYFGVLDVLSSLLDPDCIDLADSYNLMPLCWAAQHRNEAVARLLLEKGAKLEAAKMFRTTPLMCAARAGHIAVAKLLVEHGAKLEVGDEFNSTALLWAAQAGHEDIVRLLLDHCAKLEVKDIYGLTPLASAENCGHESVVKKLLERGADIEVKDNNSNTPLLITAGGRYKAMVKLLPEHGADPETKDSEGRTPLLLAVHFTRDDTAKILLEHGAKLEVRDKSGMTPLYGRYYMDEKL